MIEYALNYPERLLGALGEHLELVVLTLFCSLLLAAGLTVLSAYSAALAGVLIYTFSVIYSIPSLALFALLIPLTGLGLKTAVIVMTIYNQYLLLRNFITGLAEVDPAITEAAAGIGMSRMQVLVKIQLPLARKAIFTGIRLAVVSTIGIGTIAATINAGGLGTILFDGLRTVNTVKILWGSLLSAGLAIGANAVLSRIERKI